MAGGFPDSIHRASVVHIRQVIIFIKGKYAILLTTRKTLAFGRCTLA